MIKVKRFFLELKEKNYQKINFEKKNLDIKFKKVKNFEINKFFYRQVGMDHYWRDRLIWTDKEWSKYINNGDLYTVIMMNDKKDFIGFYELEYHSYTNEVELINMGILKNYRNKGLGSRLLTQIIEESFKKEISRIWVHTCTLDHKNALRNYISKGFKIFKEEEISFVA